MTNSIKTAIAAVALAAGLALSGAQANAAGMKLASPVAAPAADASAQTNVHKVGKRRGFRFHVHIGGPRYHHGYYHRPYRYRYIPRYRGCGWMKRKWHRTGRHYWKRRYYICRGWW
ncbi:MAG: hypothetical protein AAFO62_11770 [Pseudomonadota bacterium]